MPEDTIVIPSAAHLFSKGPVQVVTYDATSPTEQTVVEEHAITIDPLTHAVHVTLANGDQLLVTPPDV